MGSGRAAVREKYETITLGKPETVGHAWDFYFRQKKTVTWLFSRLSLVRRGFDFVFIVSLLGEHKMHQKQFN